MKSVALLATLALTACVAPSGDAGGIAVRQEASWPAMAMGVDPEGNGMTFDTGDRVPTVIVSGAPDFAAAVGAVGAFCGITTDPMAWDTQFVYEDSETGDYWFDGLCA